MSRDLESWMWAEAVRMLDQAERLQRSFYRPGMPRRPQWEPPVDVYETPEAIWIVVALPGVAPERVTLEVADGVLVVTGERRIPDAARGGELRRLEIPHGRFERRLALPAMPLRLAEQELVDGCLHVRLYKGWS